MRQFGRPLLTKLSLIPAMLIWICFSSAIAQENGGPADALPVDQEAQTSAVESDAAATKLRKLWKAYLEAKAMGEDTEAVFEQFVAWRSTYNAEVFEAAAYLFLEEGGRDFQLAKVTGDYSVSRREFHHARDMNPYLWPAYAGLARVNLAEGKYQGFINLDLRGLLQAFSFRNAYFMMDALIWFLKNISWVVVILLTLFACVLTVKYARPCYTTTLHLFEHYEWSPLSCHLFTILLLVWPLALGVNFYLTAGFYLMLFFPFYSSAERKLTAVFLLMGLLLPLCSLGVVYVNDARANPLLKNHLAYFFDGDVDNHIARLTQNPGSAEWKGYSLVTVGLLQLSKGDTLGALKSFEAVPSNSKHSALAEVNKGNIQFQSKEYQSAISHYEKALQIDPSLSVPSFNLGVVAAERGEHDKAETYKAQAAAKDKRIAQMIRYASVLPGVVLPAQPDYEARIFAALKGEGSVTFQEQVKKPAFYVPVGTLILILLLALIHVSMRNGSLLARICQKCGRVFYQSDSPKVGWCSQCVNLYVRNEDLPSEAKNMKYDEVKSFNKQKRMVMTITQLLAPGSKNLLQNHTVSGALILFVWVVLLVFTFSPVTSITHAFMTYLPGPPLVYWFWVAVCGVFWILFGLRPIWQED